MTGQGANPPDETPAPAVAQGSVQVLPGRPIRNFADLFVGGHALNDAYMRLGMLMANFAAVERTIRHIQWDLHVADARLSGIALGAAPAPMSFEFAARLDASKADKPWSEYQSPKNRIDAIERALTRGNIAAALALSAVAAQTRDSWRALGERGKALADRRNEAAHHSIAIAFKPDGPAPIRIADPFGPSTPITPAEEEALLAAIGAYDRDLKSFAAELADRLPTDERYRMF